MAELTRRAFLGRASIGTAAGVLAGGAVGTASGLLANDRPHFGSTAGFGIGESEPLVAHVRDVTTGEIALMVGTREVVYRDRELAEHLMSTARRSLAR